MLKKFLQTSAVITSILGPSTFGIPNSAMANTTLGIPDDLLPPGVASIAWRLRVFYHDDKDLYTDERGTKATVTKVKPTVDVNLAKDGVWAGNDQLLDTPVVQEGLVPFDMDVTLYGYDKQGNHIKTIKTYRIELPMPDKDAKKLTLQEYLNNLMINTLGTGNGEYKTNVVWPNS